MSYLAKGVLPFFLRQIKTKKKEFKCLCYSFELICVINLLRLTVLHLFK